MKAYYYTAKVNPPKERGEDFEYFKAYSKKQIKKHLANNECEAVEILDPTEKPTHGIYYQDITEVYYERGF